MASAMAWFMLLAPLAGCGVEFNAPKRVLVVADESIALADDGQGQPLKGGETVLTIRNESSRERQLTLARLGDLETVPPELVAIELPKDDRRIVDITPVLAPPQPGGDEQAEPVVASARFHIYLAPGERHVLFDRLGGLEQGLVLYFTPGEEEP